MGRALATRRDQAVINIRRSRRAAFLAAVTLWWLSMIGEEDALKAHEPDYYMETLRNRP
jgi:hypothetical protein